MNSGKVKDIAYYDKLGFSNYKLWSPEDLSQFIVFDYFDTFRELGWAQDENEETFLKAQKRRIQKYNKNRIILDIFDRIFSKLYLCGKMRKGKKILFQGAAYPDVIFEAKKRYNVRLMVHTKEDRLFALNHFLGYIHINDLDQDISDYLEKKDIKYLYQLVEKMEDKLRLVKPDCIVLCRDMLPLERAIVLAGKKLGIPTLVIQHGIYDSPTCSLDFKVADHVLVWGQYFKDICVEKCSRKPESVHVFGYPHIVSDGAEFNNKRRRVCYLGQNFESLDQSLLKIKLDTVNQISKICDELGLGFVYRPHPRRESKEIMEKYLSGVSITHQKETLNETFERAEIFISFSSTSLIEASMRSKVSLQLINYPVETDNWEKLGACSKSFQTIEELKTYLVNISRAESLEKFRAKLSQYYIEINSNPGQRFLDILLKINL